MRDIFTADTIKNLMKPLIDKGFFFEYFYEKDKNENAVYICRFKKGKEYLDWRETADGTKIEIAACTRGEVKILDLKKLYPKQHRKFLWKHFFRKAKADEKRVFIAGLIVLELQSEKTELFGIKK